MVVALLHPLQEIVRRCVQFWLEMDFTVTIWFITRKLKQISDRIFATRLYPHIH